MLFGVPAAADDDAATPGDDPKDGAALLDLRWEKEFKTRKRRGGGGLKAGPQKRAELSGSALMGTG